MRQTSTVLLFFVVIALTAFSVIVVWPSTPTRYLPGDFWPEGKGFSVGGFERLTMRLGLDLQGGAYLVLQADPPDDYSGDIDAALDSARNVFERRVNEFGVSEAEITRASGNRIQVAVPGLDVNDAQNLIGKTAALQFMAYNDAGDLVPATGVVDGATVAMTGEHLKNNTYPSRLSTTFAVNFETTGTGSKLMEQITSRAINYSQSDNRRLLVVMLDGQIISSAVVQSVITDVGQITGQPSFSDARDLSRQLNAGALPIPFETIQATEVSATLGDDSVVDSVHAGEIGLIAVALFMLLYYRLPGLLAGLALAVYTALTLAVFKLWPVTLTLSGIAAFVLSVGMAVDANVLIFERMKEELRRGHSLNRAIDIGFSRAWTSIRDSNVSTLITCLILFWFGDQFGSALVKGFALTLAIGVLISMFSAITVTRTFLKMVVGPRTARNSWLFNAEERHGTDTPEDRGSLGLLDFAGKRWWYLTVGTVLFVAAAVILAIPPHLRPGIEFTSGSSFTLQFTEQSVSQADLRDALAAVDHDEARVQGSGPNTFLIRTDELRNPPQTNVEGPAQPGELDEIEAALTARFGALERLDFATVSSTVSTEIARNATFAVIVAAVAILLYISWAFRGVRRSFRYGAAAIVAVLHDSFIILGLFSLLGKVNGTEVDTGFLTALLTVIGFSVHDTIVVFDRIRETVRNDPYVPFEEAVNASMTQTLARSLNTSLVVVLTVVAMLLIGGETIRNFLIVLLVGIVSGTYSSIGIASQLLVAWENNDVGRLFRRLRRGAGAPEGHPVEA